MPEILRGMTEALDAMNRGEIEPVVSLLDADVNWRSRALDDARWLQPRGDRFQVLTVQAGPIVDVQGCRGLREATRIAKRDVG